MTEERRVEPGQIVQNHLKFIGVDIVAIEPFSFMAAAREIEALSGRLRHGARKISSHDCFINADGGRTVHFEEEGSIEFLASF